MGFVDIKLPMILENGDAHIQLTTTFCSTCIIERVIKTDCCAVVARQDITLTRGQTETATGMEQKFDSHFKTTMACHVHPVIRTACVVRHDPESKRAHRVCSFLRRRIDNVFAGVVPRSPAPSGAGSNPSAKYAVRVSLIRCGDALMSGGNTSCDETWVGALFTIHAVRATSTFPVKAKSPGCEGTGENPRRVFPRGA